ncbi:MAG: glycosyltransferase family 2 protein [Desulfobacteraceae bacterium]|nr:glycosyltransferase family 2 protein [Desulfobacteraceae bacterium]
MKSTKIEIDLPPVSVIIPAYNEEMWIETTISSVLGSGFPCEVIVVDDGSSDKTPQILKTFGESIKVISHPVNKGKGAALVSGINDASGEIVIFCDAHLLGLNQYHLMTLTLPLVYGLAKATLGQGVPAELSLRSAFSPFLILTGQRAYFREDLMPLRKDMESLGYGIETFLFNRFPRDKTAAVLLPGLTHLIKKDTSSATDATLEYLREIMEILETMAQIGVLERIELTQLKESVTSLRSRFKSTGE